MYNNLSYQYQNFYYPQQLYPQPYYINNQLNQPICQYLPQQNQYGADSNGFQDINQQPIVSQITSSQSQQPTTATVFDAQSEMLNLDSNTAKDLDVLENKKKVCKNQVFDSYEAFDQYISEYFRENYWVMTRVKADKEKNDDSFRFVRVQYCCHRHEKVKSNSKSERPYQKYYANDCKCQIYMRYKKSGPYKNKYVITDLNLHHNHEEDLNKEFYDFHPKNRKLDDKQLEEVKNMLKTRA